NLTNQNTPYTFTFNNKNVFSSNTANTSFTFNWTFANTIPQQDGSEGQGNFANQTITCNDNPISFTTSPSSSYNWKSINNCQTINITAKYSLTPMPEPITPPSNNTNSSGGSGGSSPVVGTFNPNFTTITINSINPIQVTNNLTDTIAHFTINVYNLTTNNLVNTYGNPENSCLDNFSYKLGNQGASFSSQCYSYTNGKVFYINNNLKNNTKAILTFTNNFSYQGSKYVFGSIPYVVSYDMLLKNGTSLIATQNITSSNQGILTLTEQNASKVFHNTYPSINVSYIKSMNASITVNYQKQLNLAGNQTITIINNPKEIGNLNIFGIQKFANYNIYKHNDSNVFIEEYSFIPNTSSYQIELEANIYKQIFNNNYVLTIYDNSSKSFIYNNFNINDYINYPINFTFNSKDNYTIYANYFVPINITTNFLNEPRAFGSYFNWNNTPYNITNVITNKAYKNIVNSSSNTYFGLSTQSFGLYKANPITISEGFYNKNKQFTSTTMTLSDYNNIPACYTSGQVGQCLIEGIITGVPSSFITSSSYQTQENFGNYTLTHEGSNCIFGAVCSYYYQTFGYAPESLGGISISYYDTYKETTSYANLNVINPLNIVLNYGYMIPVFYAYNINESGSVSSCSNIEQHTYTSLYNYLEAIRTGYSCLFSKEYVATYYDNNIYVYNITNSFYINLSSSGISYEYNETCSPLCSGYMPVRDYYSSISGFGQHLLVNVSQSSKVIEFHNAQYILDTISYPTASTTNEYAFYEETKT
ncbi:MAG: hypothetical protein QW478_11765, partial [Candidatus Micrarchaeaceae archaeon]